MPAFIKTPKDEARWSKAKEAANKTLSEKDGDNYWALTNSIYQKMKKEEDADVIKSILEKARNRLSDEYDPNEDDDGGGEYDDLSIVDEDDMNDAADQWLKQNDPSKKDVSGEKISSRSEDPMEIASGDVEPQGKTSSEEGDKTSKEKIKELDPERLKALKAIAPHWLNHVDQVKKQTADARSNPHLFAEGHRQAAHNAAHEDFNTAHHNFINSDEYKNMSSTQKMRAEIKFKKEFQEKNPDYHKNAINSVAQAHGMHDKARELHDKEMNARKAHILSGGQGSTADTVSAQEAAQHVGASKDDEGGYSSSIVKDPAASFASKYGEHLVGEVKPKINEADEYETLENPDKKVIKHPVLEDVKNKQLINDFFNEHHPTIMRAAHRARSQAIANGFPEDKIDMSDLHEAGMHGLMQAVHDYSPEVGSFKTHAGRKMQGLMQSKLASKDYIPRDLRAKMKAKEKGVFTSKEPSEAVSSTSAVEQPVKPKVDLHNLISSSGHTAGADISDRLKRADAHRSVIRKKGE